MSRKTGVVLSYVLMIFEVLSTLLLTPFIITILGQAEYGVYKLSATIIAYLLLLDLGLGNAITRYISKFRVNNDKQNSQKFLGVATIYYLAIAVVSLITGVVLIFVFPSLFAKGLTSQEVQLGQQLIAITMINVAITLATAPYNNILIAYEKFTVSKCASIIQIVVRMVFTVFALEVGMGSVGIVLVNLITTIICRVFFVTYVFLKIKLFPKFAGIEKNFVKEIVRYSSWILLQMIATQINASIDQVMIGAMVSSASVILAVYSIGTQIVQYFQTIGNAFSGVLMPGVVALVETGAGSKVLLSEMIRIGRITLIFLGLIFSGYIVCGREFIVLWAGQENLSAYNISLILLVPYLFILTQSIGSQILWAMSKHKKQAILKLLFVVLCIPVRVLLIRWEPLAGATFGTFLSLILSDLFVMAWVFKIDLKIKIQEYYKGLFKGIAPCILFSGIMGFLVRSFCSSGIFSLIFAGFSVFLVYVTTLMGFGMNEYEKKLAKSVFIKINLKR